MVRTAIGLFAAILFGVILWWASPRLFGNPYTRVCDLVTEKIYLPDEEIRGWIDLCYERTRLVKPWTDRRLIISDVRDLFRLLELSHLDIYQPAEVRRIWQGTNAETGIVSEFVEGELVIFDIFPGSPGEAAGLRRGDFIRTVDGDHPAPQQVRLQGGLIKVFRKRKEIEVKVEPMEFALDESPRLRRLDKQAVWLRVPSFQKRFFDKEKWNETISELRKYRKIVVDLRGNNGGSFVAGLRFLSPFLCAPQEIGALEKPKSKLDKENVMPDDLSDEVQLGVVDANSRVRLSTFDDYGCMGSARVAVLVDSGTGSTAEMAAQALRDYTGARVLGISTSGSLLVGVWYEVPELGEGVKISIPEAVYRTRRGFEIESSGVTVDRSLFYALADFDEGLDSWVRSAWQD